MDIDERIKSLKTELALEESKVKRYQEESQRSSLRILDIRGRLSEILELTKSGLIKEKLIEEKETKEEPKKEEPK